MIQMMPASSKCISYIVVENPKVHNITFTHFTGDAEKVIN